MIEIISDICSVAIGAFFAFSGAIFGSYLFENKKQKSMIIFTGIMFLLSICLVVLFFVIKQNIPPVVGTVIER